MTNRRRSGHALGAGHPRKYTRRIPDCAAWASRSVFFSFQINPVAAASGDVLSCDLCAIEMGKKRLPEGRVIRAVRLDRGVDITSGRHAPLHTDNAFTWGKANGAVSYREDRPGNWIADAACRDHRAGKYSRAASAAGKDNHNPQKAKSGARHPQAHIPIHMHFFLAQIPHSPL